jgi:hypothetical protein
MLKHGGRTGQPSVRPNLTKAHLLGEDTAKATLNINIPRKKENFNSIVMIIATHCSQLIKFVIKLSKRPKRPLKVSYGKAHRRLLRMEIPSCGAVAPSL